MAGVVFEKVMRVWLIAPSTPAVVWLESLLHPYEYILYNTVRRG